MSGRSRFHHLIRPGAALGMRCLLRRRSRPYDRLAASMLVLAPHPDDETLGCGALIAAKRRAGAAVRIAFATNGDGSHPGHPRLPPEALGRRRRDEAAQAAAALGVESSCLEFFEVRDGTLDRLDPAERARLAGGMARTIAAFDPEEIFLPCRRDGSSEHEAHFLLAREAREMSGRRPRMLEFPVWAWWDPRRLWRPLRDSRRVWRLGSAHGLESKRRALAQYRSQIEAVPPWTEPVLDPDFASLFCHPGEYFFENDAAA